MKRKSMAFSLMLILCLVITTPVFAYTPELPTPEINLTQDEVTVVYRGIPELGLTKDTRVTYDVVIDTRLSVEKPATQVTTSDFPATIRYTEYAPDGSGQTAFGVLSYDYRVLINEWTGYDEDLNLVTISYWDVYYEGEMVYHLI